MNYKRLVTLTNVIAIISVVLLIYWIFSMVTIEIFELKVFQKHITEAFYMSVSGILALMVGSLMLNIMMNLTRIAQKHNDDELNKTTFLTKKMAVVMILIFPILLGFFYFGDQRTKSKKRVMLLESAESLIKENSTIINHFVNYQLTVDWLKRMDKDITLLSKLDRNFNSIKIIVEDKIDDKTVFLEFNNYYDPITDDKKPILPEKTDHIFSATQEEKEYLTKVFTEKKMDTRYSAHEGNYELFYPVIKDGKIIVLYFSDYQRYGKMGSESAGS